MKSILLKVLFSTGLILFVGSGIFASDASLNKSIDGVDIYMGITHANKAGEDKSVRQMGMIRGVRGKKHHVTVSLFDSKSGQRITDAQVIARIGEMGLSSNRKKLKQEKYGEAVSYGRDFYLSKEGPYWIDLKIKREGLKQATTARFEWNHY